MIAEKSFAEAYAKQTALRFAKWINREGYREYDEANRWICPNHSRKVYTTEQLYELFINKELAV